jgi:hypothetical protein
MEYDKRYGQWAVERPVRADDGSNPDRYAQAPDMDDRPDNEPSDVDWDSPGGFSGDPLETPKHPAYQMPTRWQGATLEEMGF